VPAGDLVWSRLTSPRSKPAVTEGTATDAGDETDSGDETDATKAAADAATEAAAG
jgi:hypothetical protein